MATTWADVANGARPRSDDDWEDVPRSSTQLWQHKAASVVHDRLAESIWPELTDSQRTLLRSQRGHMASSPFTNPPASFHARFDPQLFRVLLLRRLWQPLPPVSRICRCSRPLDSSGHHRAACANSGVLGHRGFAVESAAARVCREAGRRVSCNVFVRDLDVGVPIARDGRRLEVVTDWMPPWCLHCGAMEPHTDVQRKRMGQCCAQLDAGRNARQN